MRQSFFPTESSEYVDFLDRGHLAAFSFISFSGLLLLPRLLPGGLLFEEIDSNTVLAPRVTALGSCETRQKRLQFRQELLAPLPSEGQKLVAPELGQHGVRHHGARGGRRRGGAAGGGGGGARGRGAGGAPH